MPAGIEVYNADGSLQFSSISHRLCTVLDIFQTGLANGSRTVAGLANRDGMALKYTLGYGYRPTVTISGTTVSWTFPADGKSNTTILVLGF